jgi:hypothetical protein
MEGWSLLESRGQKHLIIAKTADRSMQPDKLEPIQGKALEQQVVPKAGGNAGYKEWPVTGVVSLDILLYGKKNKLPAPSRCVPVLNDRASVSPPQGGGAR